MIPLQHPDQLRLVLVRAHHLPLAVHVLQTHTVTAASAVITFRIIGESHWITVQRAGEVWHEVLACVPTPRCQPAFVHQFNGDDGCAFTSGGYSVQLSLVPLTAEVAARGQSGDRIEVLFPHPYGDGPLPFTRIWWAIERDAIRWWTSHVYPLAAGTVAVLSESRYVVRPATRVRPRPSRSAQIVAAQKVEG